MAVPMLLVQVLVANYQFVPIDVSLLPAGFSLVAIDNEGRIAGQFYGPPPYLGGPSFSIVGFILDHGNLRLLDPFEDFTDVYPRKFLSNGDLVGEMRIPPVDIEASNQDPLRASGFRLSGTNYFLISPFFAAMGSGRISSLASANTNGVVLENLRDDYRWERNTGRNYGSCVIHDGPNEWKLPVPIIVVITGPDHRGPSSTLVDINDEGMVVGVDQLIGSFRWDGHSEAVEPLAGFYPAGINNRGEIAANGFSGDAGVLRGTSMETVKYPGEASTGLIDINDRGMLFGQSGGVYFIAYPVDTVAVSISKTEEVVLTRNGRGDGVLQRALSPVGPWNPWLENSTSQTPDEMRWILAKNIEVSEYFRIIPQY